MSSISLYYVFGSTTNLSLGCDGTNTEAGPVYAKVYRGGSLVGSQYVATGATFSFPVDDSGLSCGTSYSYSAGVYGATSGTLYASTSGSFSTDACPAPFFPFFPPFFPPFFRKCSCTA